MCRQRACFLQKKAYLVNVLLLILNNNKIIKYKKRTLSMNALQFLHLFVDTLYPEIILNIFLGSLDETLAFTSVNARYH